MVMLEALFQRTYVVAFKMSRTEFMCQFLTLPTQNVNIALLETCSSIENLIPINRLEIDSIY